MLHRLAECFHRNWTCVLKSYPVSKMGGGGPEDFWKSSSRGRVDEVLKGLKWRVKRFLSRVRESRQSSILWIIQKAGIQSIEIKNIQIIATPSWKCFDEGRCRNWLVDTHSLVIWTTNISWCTMAEKHQNMNEILQNNITGAISTHIFLKPPPPHKLILMQNRYWINLTIS